MRGLGTPSLRIDKGKRRILFEKLRQESDIDKRDEIIEELTRMHLSLVGYLASKFKGRGELIDDLTQVGCLGLLKAIKRFDLSRGIEFTTYATPTIIGEMKRHFRDSTFMIKFPRRLKETIPQVREITIILKAELNRTPTIDEIAHQLNLSSHEVEEIIEVDNASHIISLDQESYSDDPSTLHDSEDTLYNFLPIRDLNLEKSERAENILDLYRDISSLDERSRAVTFLYYWRDMSQTAISEKLGISQMHVSRILRRALESLRENIEDNTSKTLVQV